MLAYPLTEDVYRRIVRETAARHAAREGRRRAGDLGTTGGRGGDLTRRAPARRSDGTWDEPA